MAGPFVHLAVHVADAYTPTECPGQRGAAEGHDHLGIDQLDLAVQPGPAGSELGTLRRPVVRRPALDRVADRDLRPVQPDLGQQLVEELTGPADEREPALVLAAPGRLTDEQHASAGRIDAWDDPLPGLRQSARGAADHRVDQRRPVGERRRGRRGRRHFDLSSSASSFVTSSSRSSMIMCPAPWSTSTRELGTSSLIRRAWCTGVSRSLLPTTTSTGMPSKEASDAYSSSPAISGQKSQTTDAELAEIIATVTATYSSGTSPPMAECFVSHEAGPAAARRPARTRRGALAPTENRVSARFLSSCPARPGST